MAWLNSNAQAFSTKAIDSITQRMDLEASSNAKSIRLDSSITAVAGGLQYTKTTFIAHVDPSGKRVYRIDWNRFGEFYCYATIYYFEGSAIKGIVKQKFRQTDTNPQCEVNSAFTSEMMRL